MIIPTAFPVPAPISTLIPVELAVTAVPTFKVDATVVIPVMLTFAKNVASVAVCILSVLATPINPAPFPEKLVAVITPVTLIPVASAVVIPAIVAAAETLILGDLNV